MLTALGAAFFLLGLRFMLLRWREFDIGGQRIRHAVDEAEQELRRGVIALRSTDNSREWDEAPKQDAMDEVRIVQARSDPPGPSL